MPSSPTSSSNSVDSVPFDVTGDGPTMSLGLSICGPRNRPPSIEFGCRLVASAEFRADLNRSVSSGLARKGDVTTSTDI
jgi:hypothetical protein